jgi:hypothetical protein
MDILLKLLRRLLPLWDDLRNSRSKQLFQASVCLFGFAGFLHADFELASIGLKVSQKPGLAYSMFFVAILTLGGALAHSHFKGKEIFSGVAEILKYYVSRKGGLDFAVYFKDSRDLSKFTQYANEEEIESNLKSLDLMDVDIKSVVSLWMDLAGEVHIAMSRLDERLAPTIHGHNIRVVLDPEQGGLFYTKLDGKRFVFGATLNQTRLNNGTADKEMQLIRQALIDLLSVHASRPN